MKSVYQHGVGVAYGIYYGSFTRCGITHRPLLTYIQMGIYPTRLSVISLIVLMTFSLSPVFTL
ncbi:hypothetical protein VA7868_01386 [Vibrio aerogenes CECT 7868]|uniref:Uncharacterized protein n=1 Tax=Vibrio aerogenes CECT 7868 TaxID=1216006 RepID=A0A1M5XYX9_9VIBR|nr:hypothetical protein VA7868_01386 [Vibrio aerogenes CECT 7868]